MCIRDRQNPILEKIYGLHTYTVEEICEEYLPYARILKPYMAETAQLLNEAVRAGKSILFEGAQGTLLDLSLIHICHTYVSKRFKEAVGCTMKTYASIIRTQNAIRFLSDSRYRGVTGLDIGTGLGYYDQSHFDREFKKYTTLVPGDIRAGRSTVLFH